MEMMDLHSMPDPLRNSACPDPAEMLDHLEDVLGDARLTTQEKRALLASWASDANTVPHIPSLRQLPDGSIVNVGDILRALKALYGMGETDAAGKSRTTLWTRPFTRRRLELRTWSRCGREPDDDDPPSCPAHAAIRPKGGGGAAFACAERVPA
jgi:hypothetical protein